MARLSGWLTGMPWLAEKKHRPIKGCRSVVFSALAVLVVWTALSPTSSAQVAAGTWASTPSMPTARYGLAATKGKDGRIYAIRGYQARDSSGYVGITSTVEVYDPTTNAWTTAAPMPSARYFLAAATGGDGRIYAIGGNSDSVPHNLSTVEVYDPTTNSWTTAAPMPSARSSLAAASGNDGRIYAIGGEIGHPTTVEVYDPAANTWTAIAPMSTARFLGLAAATGSDGRIYAIGGYSNNGGQISIFSAVEAYLPSLANTPTGTNVPVTTNGVAVTFASVSTAGTTTVTDSTTGPPAPTDFNLSDNLGDPPIYYNVSTTAAVSGPIVLCFTAPWVTDQAQFDLLRVLHGENGVLVDRTILAPDTPAPDFATTTICARVSSLSPFTLARKTYSWSGILQPVNADGSSIFKQGSTVAVKFQLTGGSAGITTLQAKLYVAKISNSVVGTEVEAVSTASATTGNLFRYDASGGQYIFNWGTKSQTVGAYQLRIDMPDGIKRSVIVSLK